MESPNSSQLFQHRTTLNHIFSGDLQDVIFCLIIGVSNAHDDNISADIS